MAKKVFLPLTLCVALLTFLFGMIAPSMAMASTDNGNTYTDDAGWSITYSNDGSHATVTKFTNTDYSGEVVIPDRLGDSQQYEVTKIGTFAFNNCPFITKIELPNSVTEIEDYGIYSCKNAVIESLPTNLTSIGMNGLAYSKINVTKIPDNVNKIGSGAFDSCKELTTLELPDNLSVIDENVFRYCDNLSNIKLPSHLTEIKQYAFQGCTSIKTIDFSNTKELENINSKAFEGVMGSGAEVTLKANPIFVTIGDNTQPCVLAMVQGQELNAYNQHIADLYGENSVSTGHTYWTGDLRNNLVYRASNGVWEGWENGELVYTLKAVDSYPWDVLNTYEDNRQTYQGTVEIPDSIEQISSGTFSNSEFTTLDLRKATRLNNIASDAFEGVGTEEDPVLVLLPEDGLTSVMEQIKTGDGDNLNSKSQNLATMFGGYLTVTALEEDPVTPPTTETYNVTLKFRDGVTVDQTDADRFNAYQIFDGDFRSEGENQDKKIVVSSVTWGSAFDEEDHTAILNAIKAIQYKGSKPFENAVNAADVAKVLADEGTDTTLFGSSELAILVQKAVQPYLKNVAGTSELQDVAGAENGEQEYVIKGLPSGWYMVNDTRTDRTDFTSEYIGFSIADEDVTLYIKNDVTSLDKTLVGDKKFYTIGDEVNYKVEVTLPYNVVDFDPFKMEFYDHATGLTFSDTKITVKLSHDGTEYDVHTDSADDISITGAGAGSFTLTIDDINDIDFAKDEGKINATGSDKIILYYTATVTSLNPDLFTEDGLINTVEFTYTNSPYDPSDEETLEDDETIWSAGLTMDKYGVSGGTQVALTGAEFAIKNADGKYAKIQDGKVVSWDSVTGTPSGDYLIKMTDSNTANVDGLAEGTYTVEEITAPTGYAKNTAGWTITVSKAAGTTTAASITYTGSSDYGNAGAIAGLAQTGRLTTWEQGYFGQLNLFNYYTPFTLPDTGGFTLFILILGAAIVAGTGYSTMRKAQRNRSRQMNY